MEKPEKSLFAPMNITLDFLCGCIKGVDLVTYTIQPGDTLYTICSRFGVGIEHVRELNKVADESKINAGDKLFIPATGLIYLIVPDDDGSNVQSSSKFLAHIVLGIVIAAIAVVLILAITLLWIYYKRRSPKQPVAFLGGNKSSPFSFIYPSGACKSSSKLNSHSASKGSKGSSTSFKSVKMTVFPYSEICNATSNFSESEKIGQGSYGCVYLGRLRGLVVAIKQMKNTKSKEFFAELNILCKVYHSNLIADFGLVKLLEHSPEVGEVTSRIVGTFGYLAPEYVRDGCVTSKTDVYAYGVVLMELMTGQHALTRGKSVKNAQYVEHQSVVDFVLSALEDDHDTIARLQEIIDSNLVHCDMDSLLQMALLSKDCVDDDWRRRPDMSQVVLRLSEIASSMERDEN